MSDPDARNGSGYPAEPREAQTARQVARLNRTLWIAIAITLTLLLLAWAGSTMIVIFAGLLLGTAMTTPTSGVTSATVGSRTSSSVATAPFRLSWSIPT
jgi:hypothetical protein